MRVWTYSCTIKGYTLVELAISTTIIALLSVGALSLVAKKNSTMAQRETEKTLHIIDDAVKSFIRAKHYIPCPALPQLSEDNKNFGKSEAMAIEGNVTNSSMYDNSSQLCSHNGLNHNTGIVPVRTLNLDDALAYDGWGRKISFRTASGSGSEEDYTDPGFKGDIRIVDIAGNAKTTIDNPPPHNEGALYVLISYGSNGRDVAWRRNYAYPDNGSENPSPATGIEAQNTLHDDAKTYIQDSQTAQFDDIVVYSMQKNIAQPKQVESPIKIDTLVCNNARGIIKAGKTALSESVSPTSLSTSIFSASKDVAYLCDHDPSGFKNEANPSTIPGLVTWLDAADPSTVWQSTDCETTPAESGHTVGCWKDKSGLAHHAVHSTGNNPIYTVNGPSSLPALIFNGAESLAISSNADTALTPYLLATSSHPYTIFLAGKSDSDGMFIAQKATASPEHGFFIHALSTPTPKLEMNLLGNAASSSLYNNNLFALALRWNGTSGGYFYQENYFPLATTATSTGQTPDITLGINGNGNDALTGSISEVIIFDRDLSDDTIKGIKSYLATKWNSDEGTGNSNCPTGMVFSKTVKNPIGTCHCSNPQEDVLYNTGTISACFPDNTAIGRCVGIKQRPTYDPGPSLSNLQLWLDADDCSTITLDANRRITQWNDKSANAYSATSILDHGPIYNTHAIVREDGTKLAVARFDHNNNEYLSLGTATLHTDNNLSIYAMVTTGDLTNRPTIFSTRGSNANQAWQLEYGSDGGARTNSVSITGRFSGTDVWIARSANNVLVAGNPYLFEYFRSNTGQLLFINGTAQTLTDDHATGNNIAGNSSTKLIGAGKSLESTYMMDGGIGEILLYDTRHDTTQRTRMENYLSEKWNISLSIPTDPNPGNVSINPALWLDATLINSGGEEPTVDEQTLTGWRDRRTLNMLSVSGTPKYHLNAQNGNSVVQFPNQSSYVYLPNTSTLFDSRDVSISLVYSVNNGGTDRGLFGTYAEGSSLFGYYTNSHFGSGFIQQTTETLPLSSSSFSGSNDYVISTVIASSTGSVKIYHNGIWQSSAIADAGDFSDDSFWIGATNGLSTGNAGVNMGEFIGYNTKLNRDQREAVEGYLSAKWGIPVSF